MLTLNKKQAPADWLFCFAHVWLMLGNRTLKLPPQMHMMKTSSIPTQNHVSS
jgi:hypothetical protein